MSDKDCLEKMILEQERIAKLEAQVDSIKEDVKEMRDDLKDLHSRVTTQTREIVEKMDTMQTRLEHKLQASQELAKTQHEEMQKEIRDDVKIISDRVDVLERWRWMIVGGAIALGYAISHMELFGRLFK